MKKNEEKWGMEKRNHRIPGGGGGGGFPGCDARVIVVILELICQQEALDSSWIRPSVCDLAAEAENTHTHTRGHSVGVRIQPSLLVVISQHALGERGTPGFTRTSQLIVNISCTDQFNVCVTFLCVSGRGPTHYDSGCDWPNHLSLSG